MKPTDSNCLTVSDGLKCRAVPRDSRLRQWAGAFFTVSRAGAGFRGAASGLDPFLRGGGCGAAACEAKKNLKH